MDFEIIHNGPVFPAEYKPYGYSLGNEILSPLAEEMLYCYAAKLETDYVKIDIFNKNFYTDLSQELTANQKSLIFPNDFQDVLEKLVKNIQENKIAKKEYAKNHKQEIEAEKLAIKEKFGYATLNGAKEPLNGYLIEGPGIFISRGNSPSLGRWKRRVQPEDVIINSSNKINPPAGHNWKQEKCDPNSMYAFCWKSVVGGKEYKQKEMRFGNTSSVKADSDQEKFKKAEKLLSNYSKMKTYIENGLSSTSEKTRQCALASWIIMTTGIRVGGEIDTSKRADTKGTTTLTKNDVKIDNNNICLDFIGKDSIRFVGQYPLETNAEKVLVERLDKSNDKIFTINASDVSDYLNNCVEGCTPKLFRTAIACGLWVGALKRQNIDKSMKVSEKVKRVNNASVEVAVKLNHKKNVSKTLNSQLEKIDEKIQECNEKIEGFNREIKTLEQIMENNKKIFKGKTLEISLNKLSLKKIKILENIKKTDEKIVDLRNRRQDKISLSDVAIGTAKSNYCTPAIAYAASKKYDIPINKIYSKSLIEKYKWAENTDENFLDTFPSL